MPQVTVYVTPEMHAEMRSCTGVNWSKIGRQAFQYKLTQCKLAYAKRLVKQQIKKRGAKVSHYKNREINHLARQVLAKHPLDLTLGGKL